MPTQTIFPGLRYRDAHAAIDWLCTAFGFERQAVYEGEDGAVEHAQLRHGGGLALLSTERPTDGEGGFGLHAGQGWLYVVVADPDAHYQQAKAAGAEIFREIEDQDYGSRDYSARDPEGTIWSFGTYDPGQGRGSRTQESARRPASRSASLSSEQAISLESASAASRWAWIFK